MVNLNKTLIVDKMITIGEDGIPRPANLRQLLDRDIRALYQRDKYGDKRRYIQECIVIYYLGDPKSPAKQAGLTDGEALVMAREQAGLEKDYIPDELVRRLIKRYHDENIGEAGRTVENIMLTIHNINLSISKINTLLNDKLHGTITLEDIGTIMPLIESVKKQAGDIPTVLKKLEEAKQNLMYEQETEISRGGNKVLASMDAENSII